MPARILILDDQPTMAGTAALLVAMLGYEPVQCHLPAEALCRLRDEPFDLLLTDYEMPLMDGLDVAARLRHDGHVLPVVLMSGAASRIDRMRACQWGVTIILSKPFGMVELRAALHSALGTAAA
jgi:DNA-binding response OmpR family regulator